MNIGHVLVGCMVAACSDPSPTAPDPCLVSPMNAGGSVEVGRGGDFASIVDGEEFRLELGLQGLYMFVINARARDLEIGGAELGAIDVLASNEAGTVMSLQIGCRAREFVTGTDASWELATPYFLALDPSFTGTLDGARVSIQLSVRDAMGFEANDVRTVIARLPGQNATVTER